MTAGRDGTPLQGRMDSASFVFLFTDVEGSTRLWEQEAGRMRTAMAEHDSLLRAAVQRHGGRVVKMSGDGIHAVFDAVLPAVRAITDIQLALQQPLGGQQLKVRSAVHAGPAESRDGDYFGTTVNRAARLAAAAHGGQVLVSEAALTALADESQTIAPLSLRALGVVRLRDLSAAEPVHQLVHPDLADDFPPLRAMASHPNNLPHALNAFVGRRRELEAIDANFQRARLVTLAGPGGIGKSRLALQAAARLIDRFPDGVWLVELAPVADADALVATVAAVLSVAETRGQTLTETLGRRLAEKRSLILLDNCEHLIDASAVLADKLLRAAPHLNILATSRETLDIDGEAVLQVPSLSIPDPDFPSGLAALLDVDAARLFVERVRLHSAEFAVTGAQTATLARVLYRLDGIPLAVELAAARLKTLTLAELDRGLDDRFGLLTTGSRIAAPRHKTLRALVDWSHDLLNANERALFSRLSVFAGGWTSEAATEVAADAPLSADEVPALLASLADKSLIQSSHAAEVEGPPRWRMLETLRQYAHERLDAEGTRSRSCDRHLLWVGALCRATGLSGAVPARHDVERTLELERDNLRAALDHGRGRDDLAEPVLDACRILGDFWFRRGYFVEACRYLQPWCDWLIAHPDAAAGAGDADRVARAARIFYAKARCEYMQSNTEASDSACLEAEVRYRSIGLLAEVGRAMLLRSHGLFVRDGWRAAKSVCDEGLGLMVEHAATPLLLLHDFCSAANNALHEADLEGAARYRAWAREALAGKVDLDADYAWTFHNGIAALAEGDLAVACARLAHCASTDVARTDFRRGMALVQLGTALWRCGDESNALTTSQEAVRLLKPSHPSMEFVNALEAIAAILAESGDAESACRVAGAADRVRDETGFRIGAQARAVRARLDSALARLPEVGQQAAWRSAGRLLSGNQAAELVAALNQLGPLRLQ